MNVRSASTGELVTTGPSSRKLTEMLASTGGPLSVVRQRPIASKFSCMKPNGLMAAWQPRHCACAVTVSIRCRSVAPAFAGTLVSIPGGRRAQRHAHDLAHEEHAALDEPGGGGARVRREHRRLREDAEPLRRIEVDQTRRRGRPDVIEKRLRARDDRLGRFRQILHLRRRLSELPREERLGLVDDGGGDRGCELGERAGGDRELVGLLDLEPGQEEPHQLVARLRRGEDLIEGRLRELGRPEVRVRRRGRKADRLGRAIRQRVGDVLEALRRQQQAGRVGQHLVAKRVAGRGERDVDEIGGRGRQARRRSRWP